MALKLKDLEETRSFYEQELKDEELTGGERNSYLKALKLIKRFIKIEKEAGEIERINLLPESIKGDLRCLK
ncbi:unnamed protein product [marine sediment metagenome]|uniref:Core-binding (CB) domain-containing protein n=1 Tax=marine sediment metagenome TaxID=412755 RepID=X1QPC2_9ZZZZ